MAGLYQPVTYLVDADSVFADWVLISCDVVNWQVNWNFFRPLGSFDLFHHLYEIIDRAVTCRSCKCVKWVFCMVALYIRVCADPFVSNADLSAPLTHPAHQLSCKFWIGFLAMSGINYFFQLFSHFFCSAEDSGCTANSCPCQFFTIFGDEISCDKRSHAVTK